MATFFCPNCWEAINPECVACPFCGFLLADYDRLTFEEKLLGSLNHPVFERRMVAARILGFLHSTRALAPFKTILASPQTDFYFARAILEAIAQINHPESEAILTAATQHRIELIQTLARELLERKHASERNEPK